MSNPILGLMDTWSSGFVEPGDAYGDRTIQRAHDQGYDLNVRDKGGNTALHHLASNKHFNPSLDLLCKLGADVNAKNNAGDTPLHYGVFKGKTGTLLDHGEDPNIPGNNGWTALHSAVRELGKNPRPGIFSLKVEYTLTCLVLLDAGAKVSSKDMNGVSPYDLATQCNIREIAPTLSARIESQYKAELQATLPMSQSQAKRVVRL